MDQPAQGRAPRKRSCGAGNSDTGSIANDRSSIVGRHASEPPSNRLICGFPSIQKSLGFAHPPVHVVEAETLEPCERRAELSLGLP